LLLIGNRETEKQRNRETEKQRNRETEKQVADFMDDVILLMTLEEAKEAQKDLAKFKIEAEICEL